MGTTPRASLRLRRLLSVVMAAGLILGVSGVSSAAVPTINACVNKSSKAVRISQNFHSQADCKSSKSFKQWNVTGPTGADRPQGRDRCRGRDRRRGLAGSDGSDRRRRDGGRDRRHRCRGREQDRRE